jgi:hypothetical protein
LDHLCASAASFDGRALAIDRPERRFATQIPGTRLHFVPRSPGIAAVTSDRRG